MKTLDFSSILQKAISEPGTANRGYTMFHRYSIGNQCAAIWQLPEHKVGPIATYKAWQEMGRQVKKGAKAIALCMPVTVKIKGDDGEDDSTFSRFVWRNNWFCLADTDGAEYTPETVTPAWDAQKAMLSLSIDQVPFESVNGNSQGYACGRTIAINPLATLPHKTRIHEIAHVVLGHTGAGETMTDGADIPRSEMEVEAECVAYLLCDIFGLPGQAESRHYIQGWLDGADISDKMAQRIYKAANIIVKAGE